MEVGTLASTVALDWDFNGVLSLVESDQDVCALLASVSLLSASPVSPRPHPRAALGSSV